VKILLNDSIKNRVSESDVNCMLKACDKKLYADEYAPSVEDVLQLLESAIDAESKKNRTVAKWSTLASEFKLLLK
jgi:hypothetical protein